VVDFFNEVDEDLRAQETRDLAVRWLPWLATVVGAGVVIAGGYWGFEAWRNGEAGKASLSYDRGMQALQAGNATAADAAFAEVASRSAMGYKAMALMQRAGIALADNRRDDAVKFFDEAAKVARSQPIIADAAALKAAYALMDTAPYATLEARLKPLTDQGRPYRPMAIEALAMAKLAAGRTAEARADLDALSLQLDAPQGVQARTHATVQLIDSGSSGVLPKIAKAAAALPPLPPQAPNAAAAPQGAQPNAAPQAAAPAAPAQAPAGAPAQ
jgi:hypothetical protein